MNPNGLGVTQKVGKKRGTERDKHRFAPLNDGLELTDSEKRWHIRATVVGIDGG